LFPGEPSAALITRNLGPDLALEELADSGQAAWIRLEREPRASLFQRPPDRLGRRLTSEAGHLLREALDSGVLDNQRHDRSVPEV